MFCNYGTKGFGDTGLAPSSSLVLSIGFVELGGVSGVEVGERSVVGVSEVSVELETVELEVVIGEEVGEGVELGVVSVELEAVDL